MISAVGIVLHTLPEGNDVWGVTSLDNLLYVIRDKASQQISVYDTDNYRLQRRINVPQLDRISDMTACAYYYCLYISDGNKYIHSVALPHITLTKWPVYGKPAYLSVTKAHTLLVTFDKLRVIREFTTHGDYSMRLIYHKILCHRGTLSSCAAESSLCFITMMMTQWTFTVCAW